VSGQVVLLLRVTLGWIKQMRSEVIKNGPVARSLKNLWPEP